MLGAPQVIDTGDDHWMLPLVARSDELVETVKQAINDAGVPHAVPRDENGRISLFRMGECLSDTRRLCRKMTTTYDATYIHLATHT